MNNPPTSGTITVRYSKLQTLGSGGLTTEGAPGLNAFSEKMQSADLHPVERRRADDAAGGDRPRRSYVGQHRYNLFNGVNINAIDFGSVFPAGIPDRTQTPHDAGVERAPAEQPARHQGLRGHHAAAEPRWRTYHSIQLSLNRRFRNGLSFGVFDVIGLSDRQQAGARLQHNDGRVVFVPCRSGEADELLGENNPVRNTVRANFVWDLPDLRSASRPSRPSAMC